MCEAYDTNASRRADPRDFRPVKYKMYVGIAYITVGGICLVAERCIPIIILIRYTRIIDESIIQIPVADRKRQAQHL